MPPTSAVTWRISFRMLFGNVPDGGNVTPINAQPRGVDVIDRCRLIELATFNGVGCVSGAIALDACQKSLPLES